VTTLNPSIIRELILFCEYLDSSDSREHQAVSQAKAEQSTIYCIHLMPTEANPVFHHKSLNGGGPIFRAS